MLLNKRTFCVVTGASRGIGKEIAHQLAPKFGPSSLLVLLSRNTEELAKTKDEILAKSKNDIKVLTFGIDLSLPDGEEYSKILDEAFRSQKAVAADFEQAVLIHNAGIMGDAKPTKYYDDIQELRSFYDLVVISPMCLNAKFLQKFDDASKARLIINITSRFSVTPRKTYANYCTGKAARDMFFRVVALENPSVLVLTYSPGPVNTDMFRSACTGNADPELKEHFKDTISSGRLLEPSTTIKKLLDILENGKFLSGDRVDYHDN